MKRVNKAVRDCMKKLLLFLSIAFVSSVYAQTASENARVDANNAEVRINQIDTSAFPKVTIFATVLRDGNPVQGLQASDFRVREDEVDQEPLTVVEQHSALNAVITLDTSGSIRKALPQVQSAAINFLGSLDGSDKFDVISFSREVKTISSDGNKAQAIQSIQQTVARGDTALFDAIYESIAALQGRKGRKAVILLTDGVDDNGRGGQLSKKSLSEALELAKSVNVPVFSIGLGQEKDVATLERIAKETGGRYFDAITPEQLQGIYEQIGKEISGQYNIFYTSNLPADGSIHRVNLTYSGAQGIKEYESPTLAGAGVGSNSVAVPQTEQGNSRILSLDAGLHVAVTLTAGGPEVEFNSIEVHTKPISAFEKPKRVETCYARKTFCSFQVAEGRYSIVAKKGNATASVEVEVDPSKSNQVWINLNAGLLRTVTIPADQADPIEVSTTEVRTVGTAFKKSERVATCYNKKQCEFYIQAGDYTVSSKKESAHAEQVLTIEAGKVHDAMLNLNASIINVVTVLSEGATPVKANSVNIYKKPASSFDKRERVDSCYSKETCRFTVNAGTYEIEANYGGATKTDFVSVEVGQEFNHSMNLSGGVVKVVLIDANGNRANIDKAYLRRAEKQGQVQSCYGKDVCEFKVQAGAFSVEVHGGSTMKSREFTVKAGEVLNIEVK